MCIKELMKFTKHCSKCAEYFTSRSKTMYYCPDCERKYKKAYRRKNKIKIKEYLDSRVINVEEVEFKQCPKCEKLLSKDKFHKDKSKVTGLFSICKECRRKK